MNFLSVFAVLFGLIAISLAKPLDNSQTAQILRFDNENNGFGGYRFGYETSDGVARQEEAELKNIGTDNEALSVRGTISYVGDDGQTYTMNYIADEYGFRPEGAHLPRAAA